MSLSCSATLHFKIMHDQHPKIKVHQGRKGSAQIHCKKTAWCPQIATLYTTISCRVRLTKIWGQGESKPVFSKVHFYIFKCKMQWLFMFHSLLSLTWPDNFFQANLLPKVPEVIWASAKSSSPWAPINSKSRWKAWHTISAEGLKRFWGLPAGWWQCSPDKSSEHMTN